MSFVWEENAKRTPETGGLLTEMDIFNNQSFLSQGILTTLEGAKKWKPDREELNKVSQPYLSHERSSVR
jgi:hypothetical protein